MRSEHRRHEKLEPRKDKVVERRKIEDFNPIEDRHLEWLSERGISASTALKYELVGYDKGDEAVVGFPYYDKTGNVVALKQRFTGEKKFLCWQTPDSFFGIRHLKKGDNIYIVEGEMDVLALAEVGVRAVSVPNGAPRASRMQMNALSNAVRRLLSARPKRPSLGQSKAFTMPSTSGMRYGSYTTKERVKENRLGIYRSMTSTLSCRAKSQFVLECRRAASRNL
jgi:hypothetical protein